ncbi:hypothetical protein JCM19992_34120 [Thermostilla marina]
MPRLVVLKHDAPRGLHWDLLLETHTRLWTFAVSEPPRDWVKRERMPVERLPDHRRRYLEYEGPISDNRGAVSRCDAGDYVVLLRRDGRLRLAVETRLLRGILELSASTTAEAPSRWTLSFREANPSGR